MIYICLECEATPLRPPRISRPSFFNPLAGLGLPQRLPQVGSAGNCCGLQLEERTESMESEDRRPIAWKYLHRQVETLVKPPSTRPLHTHAALFSLRWSGSRLDLGYIILLSCNYEMCRADLEPNEQEESPEEGCTHAEKKQQQKPKKPELHRKLRLLCAGLLWIKSRAERAAKNIKKSITRSYGYLLVLQVPRVLQKNLPCTIFHTSGRCQHPTSLIMTIISAWCSFLDLVFFSAAADLRSRSVISASVCVGMGSLLDIIDMGEGRRKIAVRDLWHSFRKHFGMPCSGGWFSARMGTKWGRSLRRR